MTSDNRLLTPLTEDNLKTIGCCLKGYVLQKQFESNIPRIVENKKLRQFIINLRDEPEPISTQEVIERLIGFTEDLKP